MTLQDSIDYIRKFMRKEAGHVQDWEDADAHLNTIQKVIDDAETEAWCLVDEIAAKYIMVMVDVDPSVPPKAAIYDDEVAELITASLLKASQHEDAIGWQEHIEQLNTVCEDFGCKAGTDRIHWLHERLAKIAELEDTSWIPHEPYHYPAGIPIRRTALEKGELYLQAANGEVRRLKIDFDNVPILSSIGVAPLPEPIK